MKYLFSHSFQTNSSTWILIHRSYPMSLKAIEFPGNTTWLNTDSPLTLDDLKGQVVLLYFWSSFFTECLESSHEISALVDAYRDRPFMVIGVHSSPYGELIETRSIAGCMERYGIRYPVIIDNDLIIWNKYGISQWPSYIIIDAEGMVIGAASGEDKQSALDRVISTALEDGVSKGILAPGPKTHESSPAGKHLLSFPEKIEIDKRTGNLFVSDTCNHRILRLSLKEKNSAVIDSITGVGTAGFSDGPGNSAEFNHPMGLCCYGSALYVADAANHAVRMVDQSGNITTIAGMGKPGYSHTFNGNPLKTALNTPCDIVSDGAYLYIAMTGLNQIWRLDVENNYISNLIGSGIEGTADGQFSTTTLSKPRGLALRGNYLYIADSGSSSIRCADLHNCSLATLAGAGIFDFGYIDGHFTDARMLHCQGLEAAGEKLFIADTYNHSVRFAELAGNVIRSLISRRQESTFRIRDESQGLFEPGDLAYYNGKLYIADTGNHRIMVFDLSLGTLNELVIGAPASE